MDKCTRKLSLCQRASYQIEVVGHLDVNKATWFECLTLANEFGEDGTPITIMTGEVPDQAALHGLLKKVRDLGIPLVSVNFVNPGRAKTQEVKS